MQSDLTSREVSTFAHNFSLYMSDLSKY